MTMLDDLEMKFGYDNPFFIEDVVNDRYSYDVVRKMLSTYVKEGFLKRYSQGIYYFSQMTILGESRPLLDEVLEKKYIYKQNEIHGFISGLMLLNRVGLITQVPNDVEIVTNFEKSRKRTIHIRKSTVVLRNSKIKITAENVGYLQFLDIIRCASVNLINENLEIIVKFFKEQKLKLDVLREYVLNSSPSIKKKIRECRIYDVLTLG